jgi:hypothetical protein
MSTISLFPDLACGTEAAPEPRISLDDIARLARAYTVFASAEPNPYGPSAGRQDPWASWTACIESGRTYLTGTRLTTAAFERLYRRRLEPWMVRAYVWARQNPDRTLVLHGRRYAWHVFQRGEYVSFQLPFHDSGGERDYVSRDGRTRILVNDD